MNFKKIIEDGYGRLAEKLPEEDKAFLKGFNYAIEQLKNFKESIDDYIEQDAPTLKKIEEELSEITVENAIQWLEDSHDEILVSFVDSNHYSINEHGEIVDDKEDD